MVVEVTLILLDGASGCFFFLFHTEADGDMPGGSFLPEEGSSIGCFNLSCFRLLLLEVRLATLRRDRLVAVAAGDLRAGESGSAVGPDATVWELRSSKEAILLRTAEDLMVRIRGVF